MTNASQRLTTRLALARTQPNGAWLWCASQEIVSITNPELDALETKEARASMPWSRLLLSLAPVGDCSKIQNVGQAI